MVLFAIAAWAATLFFLWCRPRWALGHVYRGPRSASRENHCTAPAAAHTRRKPAWVLREVIELKATCSAAGVRKVADLFNRRHAPRMTVGKTWVDERLREHAQAVAQRRRELRRLKPWALPINADWALDISYLHGNRSPIFAVIDQGSRRLLRLAALPRKCTFTLLGHVCFTVAEFGVPRAIRTDNESMFTSRLWQRALRWLRIRHQRIETKRPWQNGRVERLFGTVKPWLRMLLPAPALCAETQRMLDLAKLAYNEHRPHQALGGLTPMQVWCGANWDDVARENELRHSRDRSAIGERRRC
jgi:putative transposase